ncbi:MAG: hypothetical protein PHV97_03895 [Candidatus Omnitrophica bacterium]|nr:hypothetical protein [Candidatus Omnitrophota bacterium]
MNDDIPTKIKSILDVAERRASFATECSREGNKYEFDTCDLLLKGAGAALFLYLTLIQIPSTNLKLNFEPLIYWGCSLFLGVWHKLSWSRKLLRLADKNTEVHAYIINELSEAIYSPSDIADGKVAALLQGIISEEREYLGNVTIRQEKIKREWKYIAPGKKYSQWPIYLQLALISCGALSAFQVLSLWSLICKAVIKLVAII